MGTYVFIYYGRCCLSLEVEEDSNGMIYLCLRQTCRIRVYIMCGRVSWPWLSVDVLHELDSLLFLGYVFGLMW